MEVKDESSHSRIQEVALAEVKEEVSHPVSQNLMSIDHQRGAMGLVSGR